MLQFSSKIQQLSQYDVLNNLVVNFGFNRIQKITNVWFDSDGTTFYVKLYQPINDEILEKDTAWFSFELLDPYIDTLLLTSPVDLGETTQIRGPNFNLDTSIWVSNATSYKSFEDVLDANLDTQQKIIDNAISSSGYSKINVDYTDFSNFIFYSSAEERLRNFHYKLSKVEEYSGSISTLLNSTASNTVFVSASIEINRNRINELTSNLDPFERWLYYETTSSIFSHTPSGSLTPWPKYLYNGSWVNYSVSHSLSTAWFNANIYSASVYDLDNTNRLYWAIPEHIIMDAANSNFITFVDLVGQHYDVIYAYIKGMTQINERDEHPDRGPSKDILWHIANSYGWKLQNTRQLADLWKYKLGANQSGSYDHTGSLFEISGENQTYQIWRRIVNNLPYLLKTKGTGRSVKALLSIYGIRDTLLSIKEYGGPSIRRGEPGIIEPKFHYSLNFTGSNYISLPRRPIPTTSGSWSANGYSHVPGTIVFSFATNYSSSVSMSLWGIQSGSEDAVSLNLIHYSSQDLTGSYSGSFQYGKLELRLGSGSTESTFSTQWEPFYNNEYWTVGIRTDDMDPEAWPDQQPLSLLYGQASDCGRGLVYYNSASGTLDVTQLIARSWGASLAAVATPCRIHIGGVTGSLGKTRFIGKIKGYKEYFTHQNTGFLYDDIFKQHVLNPSAYHISEPSGAYYSLYRHFPLGIDAQRWNHVVYTQVSSSHPNQRASFDTTASFVGFTGDQTTQYIPEREVEYVYTPSLGDYPIIGQKVRLENTTQRRDLSLTNIATTAEYDLDSLDSNRLAIVFSQTDHLNRDIYNQLGQFKLDEFVGDPDREFEDSYPDLYRFRQEYFQKFQQRNDINAFIRILAVYDYTFFEQLKQLVPARADLIDGILVEDHVLHRNKVRLSRKPSVEDTQWEQTIDYQKIQSAEYHSLETAVTSSPDISFTYSYLTSSIVDTLNLDVSYIYFTGSIPDLFIISGCSFSHLDTTHQRTGLVGSQSVYPNPFSGSQSETQSIFETPKPNCCYQRVIYHYSASGTFPNEYTRQWYTAVSMSYKMYYSRSLECTSYQINECSSENNKRYRGSKLEGSDFNINSPNTIDGGPVITITEVNPNQLKVFENPAKGNLKVE